MAAQECSQCGARIRADGTSPCTCVLTAAEMVDAVFDALEPRELKSSSRRRGTRRDKPVPDEGAGAGAVAGTDPVDAVAAPDAAPEGDTGDGADEESARPRVRKPGKGAVVGVVAAMTLGVVAFTVGSEDSDQDAQQRGKSPVPATTDWNHAPPQPMDGSRPPSGSARPGSDAPEAQPSSHEGADEDEAGKGAGHGDADGGADESGSPSPSGGDSSPPPAEDASGGDSEGGDSSGGGSGGGDSGGSSGGDQGGSDGGGSGGDEDGSGGLLGGLLGGILGGGDKG